MNQYGRETGYEGTLLEVNTDLAGTTLFNIIANSNFTIAILTEQEVERLIKQLQLWLERK